MWQKRIVKIACKDCGSEDVIRYGSYEGVQRYLCHSCGGDDSPFHMKVPDIIDTDTRFLKIRTI